jgi:hypothetical protein
MVIGIPGMMMPIHACWLASTTMNTLPIMHCMTTPALIPDSPTNGRFVNSRDEIKFGLHYFVKRLKLTEKKNN